VAFLVSVEERIARKSQNMIDLRRFMILQLKRRIIDGNSSTDTKKNKKERGHPYVGHGSAPKGTPQGLGQLEAHINI
jgi:hypothetical protein